MKGITNNKTYIVFAYFMVSFQVLFGKHLTSTDILTYDKTYYNPTMGYIMFRHDSLWMCTPESCDSSRFHKVATCVFENCDSSHIKFKSINTQQGYRTDMINIVDKTYDSEAKGLTINVTITGDKQILEYRIEEWLFNKEKKWMTLPYPAVETQQGTAQIYMDYDEYPEARNVCFLSLSLWPANNQYIASNPQGVFFGLLYIQLPTIEIGSNTTINLCIDNFTYDTFNEFYIPESYMTFNRSQHQLSWRGYVYDLIE